MTESDRNEPPRSNWWRAWGLPLVILLVFFLLVFVGIQLTRGESGPTSHGATSHATG